MIPFHNNPTAPPSTATGEQRTLLKVSSTVVVANDNNQTPIPISFCSSKEQRSTKGWFSFLAAATLLLVCIASRSGVFQTFHYSHLLRGNPGSSDSRSEISAVHVPEAGTKGGSCLFFWGTSCDSDLSCDDNHVCQDNAGPRQPCGYDANGIDCVADYWCKNVNDNGIMGWDDDNPELWLCEIWKSPF